MSRRKSDPLGPTTRRAPAISPEDRESQLTSLAYDLAEKQLRDGTASSQVITEFLKRGSTRDQLEREKLKSENALLATKRELMESQKAVEELYKQALSAMRTYSGQPAIESDAEYGDFDDPDVF